MNDMIALMEEMLDKPNLSEEQKKWCKETLEKMKKSYEVAIKKLDVLLSK